MTSEETQISEELKGCYENLIVIDIGANLTNKKYGRDLESVVQRAKDAGTFSSNIAELILTTKIACKYVYNMPTLMNYTHCKRS